MVEGSSVSMQRILLTCCVAVLGCSTTLHAQQPEPTDARAFLEQHAVYQNSSKATRAAEEATLARARLYLHAGAENELRQEVAKLTESHPVGLRYAMLADCWRPGSYRQGLERASQWLQIFPERSLAEQQAVLGVQAFLATKEQQRSLFLERRAATAWLPFLSLAAVMALVAGGLRWWP
jgi:hypothetical protein